MVKVLSTPCYLWGCGDINKTKYIEHPVAFAGVLTLAHTRKVMDGKPESLWIEQQGLAYPERSFVYYVEDGTPLFKLIRKPSANSTSRSYLVINTM